VTRPKTFPQTYIKKCFDVWYLGGRPNFPLRVKEIIPEYDGQKPSTSVIKRWMINGMWDEWADEMDARAMVLSNDALVNKKAKMLIRHQEDAMKIAEKALLHLVNQEFDSSSAAVQAYFKSTEEQRKTAGFSDLLERLDKMTNNDVEKEIIALLNRGSENDQIIDSEAVIIQEDKNGENDGTED
jgi:hypothetical protein